MFERQVEQLRLMLGPPQGDLDYIEQLELELAAVRSELQRTTERAEALQGLADKNMTMYRELLEPQQKGACRKIRHQLEDLAVDHAERLARRHPGERFGTYQCRKCPGQPASGLPYWHVGHRRGGGVDAIRFDPGCICLHSSANHRPGCDKPGCICGRLIYRQVS